MHDPPSQGHTVTPPHDQLRAPAGDARCNTHHKFKIQVETSFANGMPTEEEWGSIMEDDTKVNYTTSTVNPPLAAEELEIYKEAEIADEYLQEEH